MTEEPLPSRWRWKRIVLVAVLVLALPAAWLLRYGASKLEFFHLRHVAIEGTRYLGTGQVMERLALDTLRSVWDDTKPLEAALRAMPQVSEVSVRRKLPGTLLISISENPPVAFLAGPGGIDIVDSKGTALPIDPVAEEIDLPIVSERNAEVLATLGDLRAADPQLFRRISHIERDGKDDLLLRIAPVSGLQIASPDSAAPVGDSVVGPVRRPRSLLVRAPLGVSAARLADIFPVESDLARRRANVAELDLRYRDQVIARLQ